MIKHCTYKGNLTTCFWFFEINKKVMKRAHTRNSILMREKKIQEKTIIKKVNSVNYVAQTSNSIDITNCKTIVVNFPSGIFFLLVPKPFYDKRLLRAQFAIFLSLLLIFIAFRGPEKIYWSLDTDFMPSFIYWCIHLSWVTNCAKQNKCA